MPQPKNPFAAKLVEILLMEPDAATAPRFNAELARAFLDCGSDSPDNLSCMDRVEYGTIADQRWGAKTTFGLRLKRYDVMLSDIMQVIENSEIPPEVKKAFPGLTGEEWDAATRMITRILAALEKTKT